MYDFFIAYNDFVVKLFCMSEIEVTYLLIISQIL